MAFAALAEAGAGRADDLGLVEQEIEKFPRVAAGVDPDVGGVFAADAGEAELHHCGADEGGVGEIEVGHGLHLRLALGGVDGGGGLLHGVGDAVELGRVAAVPEGVNGVGVARRVVGHEGLGHDGVGAARAGEAGGLGEAAELDGTVAGPLDLVDGVGDLRVADVGLVGAVEEDDGLVGPGVGDPRFELGARGDGAGRVVGEAQVDQVRRGGGDGGHIAVGGGAFEVGDAGVAAVEVGAGAAGHDVGININRIHGVGDGKLEALGGEDFLDVAAVALGAVGDEDFVGVDLRAAGGIIVGGDQIAEERVALLGAVALEGGAVGHFFGATLERINANLRQGLGDIADAKADDGFIGVGLSVGRHALGDVGEQIGRLQFQVIFVDADHGGPKGRKVSVVLGR